MGVRRSMLPLRHCCRFVGRHTGLSACSSSGINRFSPYRSVRGAQNRLIDAVLGKALHSDPPKRYAALSEFIFERRQAWLRCGNMLPEQIVDQKVSSWLYTCRLAPSIKILSL